MRQPGGETRIATFATNVTASDELAPTDPGHGLTIVQSDVPAAIGSPARSRGARPDYVTEVERVAIVLAPVAAVLTALGLSVQKLVAIAVATTVWVVALRIACTIPRPSTLALGTTAFTAVGTTGGLAAISVIDFWVPGLDLGVGELLLMTGGVLLTSSVFAVHAQRRASPCRLLLVGGEEGIREVLDELARQPRLPFDVLGVVDDDLTDRSTDAAWLGTTDNLAAILEREQPDLVIFGNDAPRGDAVAQMLDTAPDVRVVDVHHFHEHAFGRVPVHHLSPMWFMSVLHLYQRPYSRVVKRALDVFVASVALVVFAPLLLVVSLVVRFSSPGPIFFRQLRLGEAGDVFEMLKFRTMVDGAEAPGEAVWATARDSRVTPVGRVLRRTRIDELPQLWNVVRGDMSIIGPRPERPEFLELLSDAVPFWTRRHLVKPGITGWAQVRRGYTSDATGTADKLAYDLYYIKYRSLLFDLVIVYRTVAIVLSGFGSR